MFKDTVVADMQNLVCTSWLLQVVSEAKLMHVAASRRGITSLWLLHSVVHIKDTTK